MKRMILKKLRIYSGRQNIELNWKSNPVKIFPIWAAHSAGASDRGVHEGEKTGEHKGWERGT